MNGKSIFLIVLIIIAGFLGYKFFWPSDSTSTDGLMGLAPAGVNPTSGGQNDEFLALLTDLKDIHLDGMNQVLATLGTLQDFSVELKPQAPGRNNPFAPIGVDSKSTATSSATSTRSNSPN